MSKSQIFSFVSCYDYKGWSDCIAGNTQYYTKPSSFQRKILPMIIINFILRFLYCRRVNTNFNIVKLLIFFHQNHAKIEIFMQSLVFRNSCLLRSHTPPLLVFVPMVLQLRNHQQPALRYEFTLRHLCFNFID